MFSPPLDADLAPMNADKIHCRMLSIRATREICFFHSSKPADSSRCSE
jgi:hypothetical protein